MIFELTSKEKKELATIENSYRKLISEADALVRKLAPDTPPPADVKDFDEWLNSGSQEWRAAREKRFKLTTEASESRAEFYISVFDAHFAKIADNPDAIVANAREEIDLYIEETYKRYEHTRATGINEYGSNVTSFAAVDVRATDNGFLLDADETISTLLSSVVSRHLKALKDDEVRTKLIRDYIAKAVADSPYTSSEEGTLGGYVTAAQKSLIAITPREYKRPNTKVHNLLFNNELTTKDSRYFERVGLNRQKNVVVYANFIPQEAVELLGLDDYHERLYAGIGSCLFAGNQFIPFTMLYNRGMLGLGTKTRAKELTPNIEQDIIDGLAMFDGRVTITNDPTGEHKNDPDFKTITIREPLLFYQLREEKVNGQVTRGIAIPDNYIPVLYRYAEINRNEVQTDPIEAIHVDGLTYSRDNIIIQNVTYKRVKEIQYHDGKKRYRKELPENQRTITYSFVAQRMKRDFSTMTPTERNRLKHKIDDCMKSYQKSGLFARYEHKRDATKSYYAVVIYFEREPAKLE